MKPDNELMKKMVKKGVAVLAAGTLIATALTGCTKQDKPKNAVLEGTILEQAQVMIVGEEPIIVTPVAADCSSGSHYKDVVTGTVYQITKCTTEKAELMIESSQKQKAEYEAKKEINEKEARKYKPAYVFVTKEDVKKYYECRYKDVENYFEDEVKLTVLTNKLTAEDLNKAMEGKFTDADVIAIQQRIAKELKTK